MITFIQYNFCKLIFKEKSNQLRKDYLKTYEGLS
jgi:hypothetical protein